MKKIALATGFMIIFSGLFLIYGQILKNESNANTVESPKNGKSSFFFQKSIKKPHQMQGLNCKTCHNCEYPTKEDPCIEFCPREGMVSVHHSPSESPDIITLDSMSVRFGAVVFSHKQHAQMSEMSDGCQGCHHYNTTGPILACRKCHEKDRKRDNIRKVDLKGAYHRQCMNCHRQWTHTTDCNSCHLPKNPKSLELIEAKKKEIAGKDHPPMQEPSKIVYETGFEKGKIVTFYHRDHVSLFNISCNSCHRDENCIKCHDNNNSFTHALVAGTRKEKIHKELDLHHEPCNACHKQDQCGLCHQDKELEPWNHDKSTRFALKHYHDQLSCEKCHARRDQFTKLNIECNSCHKEWTLGKFDHKVTGLQLSENHIELDCEICHANRKFTGKPTCEACHDDKHFPKFMPGKMVTPKINGKMVLRFK
jgi:hypothetical protein